jgi:hypothetical protein
MTPHLTTHFIVSFYAYAQDLAELIQAYFQAIVKCPTSDPAKSINHTLRAAALCAALSAPRLGLVDGRRLLRSDVEIAIKRQQGVRLFSVFGAAFTLLLCGHRKHRLDAGAGDAGMLLLRLVELLTEHAQRGDLESENVWMQSSMNQQQGLDSPLRRSRPQPAYSAALPAEPSPADDDAEEFAPDDLLAASRLLHRELRAVRAVFEGYPSCARRHGRDTARSSDGRSLDTVVLLAKDFGICPSLMDRTQCIHIIGQEIRSQNDPDWVCQDADISVSFSQFQIFLMNVALKNKNFGASSGFVTATQKLAGLLWWMDNSGGKERLHERDRNYKVSPFRVHGLIPSVRPAPKGEDFWLEK